MMTSRSDAEIVDLYLLNKLSISERDSFEERISKDRKFRFLLELQHRLHFYVKSYHRRRFKEEIAKSAQDLFLAPENAAYFSRIKKIFK